MSMGQALQAPHTHLISTATSARLSTHRTIIHADMTCMFPVTLAVFICQIVQVADLA